MNRKIAGIFIIAILSSVMAVNASALTDDRSLTRKERKEADRMKVDKMLADTVYTLDVTTAMPLGWKSINLTSRYNLKVDKDKVVSSLPYYGRAYSIPYGGGDGLMFEGKAEDYSIVPGKKGARKVSFTVRTKEDTFDFHMEISPEGTSSLTVISNNRQPISFYGRLDLLHLEDD